MQKNVLIIEDEKLAQDHLSRLLLELEPHWHIAAKLDSVQAATDWLGRNTPDLIFLDIHLADDICFRIFEQVRVLAPVVFTTAYDQYALKAFQVNSIDYLLKPIEREDLRRSLDKFRQWQGSPQIIDVQQLLQSMQAPARQYQERFVVQRGEKLLSVTVNQIAYFEGEDRYVYLIKRDGSRYIVNYRLSDLEEVLDPKQFYKLNRSFITHFDAIQNIVNLSKSRMKVELTPAARREIIVSSENTAEFKLWLNQ